jgi:hypothetical protein
VRFGLFEIIRCKTPGGAGDLDDAPRERWLVARADDAADGAFLPDHRSFGGRAIAHAHDQGRYCPGAGKMQADDVVPWFKKDFDRLERYSVQSAIEQFPVRSGQFRD